MAAVVIPDDIKEFLNNLINISLEQDISDDDREVLLVRLYEELDQYIMGAAIDALPDDKIDDYQKMVDSDTDRDGMLNFFRQNVSNLQEVINTAVVEFQAMYMDAAEDGAARPE